ncbi:MAG: GntR family transcriptional regulator [Ruminococcus sp.]
MFQIDPMSREPVYEQIIAQVERFILTDVLQPGSQIPSVRNVSMTNSINPRTILKAYTDLDARGLIQSVPGKGYFVCADAQEKLLQKGRAKMKDLTELLTELAIAGVTKEEISACVEQAFADAEKQHQQGGTTV